MSTPQWGQQPAEQAPHQPGYPAYIPGGPNGPYGHPPVPSTNGLAIASMVVSIVSLTMCMGATGFIGAILGHVSKGQIRRGNEQGGGMATAGIVIGWLGFGLFVAGVVAFVGFVVLVEGAVSEYCYTDSNGNYVCD